MTLADLPVLLPFFVLGATAALAILLIAFYRNHAAIFVLSIAGLLLTLISMPLISSQLPRQVTSLLIIDRPAIYFTGLLVATSLVVVLLSYGYLQNFPGHREEYYVLLLLATSGSVVLVIANHFISFFLGLEILSVSLYALIAYPRLERARVEAGIKYLVLAGATSAFLLFGMALIYSVTGTMQFSGSAIAPGSLGSQGTVLLVGWGLLMVGMGFKLALVPFHLWTPDVYQGAPAPVTGFIATVSKGGMFALLFRYFSLSGLYTDRTLWWLFAAIAIASMLYGNLVALMQTNVKRILAYSSIAHLGYLMVAFLSSGSLSSLAIGFYLAAYFITNLSAFGVITVLSTSDHEVDELEDYRGLVYRRRGLAVIFTVALLSLAGIPPSAGLIGKIYLAAAGVQSALWLLLIVLVIASIIGVFYYLRIVITMFRRTETEEASSIIVPSLAWPGNLALTVLTILLLGLGIYPGPLVQIVERLVTGIR